MINIFPKLYLSLWIFATFCMTNNIITYSFWEIFNFFCSMAITHARFIKMLDVLLHQNIVCLNWWIAVHFHLLQEKSWALFLSILLHVYELIVASTIAVEDNMITYKSTYINVHIYIPITIQICNLIFCQILFIYSI